MLNHFGRFEPWEDGFDFTPPALHEGESAGPPDFVGVGVQKAGTSWWFSLILEHPEVTHRVDIHKERHFLSRFLDAPFGDEEIRRYHGWFPRQAGKRTGEWTPDYLAQPWVPPLLAAAAPDAKVLVLVRDPIERFRSGLTFRLRAGGAPDTAATVAEAVRQGFYADALERMFRSIDRDRVLVLQYERCCRDPAGQLAETYRFLELAAFEPPDLRREVNVSEGEKVDLAEDALRHLAELYRADVEALPSLAPGIDIDLWPNFARSVR